LPSGVIPVGDIPPFGLRPPFGTVGVGQNENAIPDMRGTNGGSRDTMPFRIVPERGKVAENGAKSPSKKR